MEFQKTGMALSIRLQNKKKSFVLHISARDERLLMSYAVPLFFMNEVIHSGIRKSSGNLSDNINQAIPVFFLYPLQVTVDTVCAYSPNRIWGRCSEASSTISFRCFSPANSSLCSSPCVLFLITAFRICFTCFKDYHGIPSLSIFFC